MKSAVLIVVCVILLAWIILSIRRGSTETFSNPRWAATDEFNFDYWKAVIKQKLRRPEDTCDSAA